MVDQSKVMQAQELLAKARELNNAVYMAASDIAELEQSASMHTAIQMVADLLSDAESALSKSKAA